jgi:hypothetical protein
MVDGDTLPVSGMREELHCNGCRSGPTARSRQRCGALSRPGSSPGAPWRQCATEWTQRSVQNAASSSEQSPLPVCQHASWTCCSCCSCVQANLSQDTWELAPSDALSVTLAYTLPTCLLQVVRHGEFVGFRMQCAEKRMLQFSRRHRRLFLVSDKFGVYEQLRILEVRDLCNLSVCTTTAVPVALSSSGRVPFAGCIPSRCCSVHGALLRLHNAPLHTM